MRFRAAVAIAFLVPAGSWDVSSATSATGDGRLRARPQTPTATFTKGMSELGMGKPRDGLLYVPPGYRPDKPAPFVVLLHGAGQDAHTLMDPMRPLADELGLVLLAPESRQGSWDVRYGGYDVDVEFIDAALAKVFAKVNIDPARIGVAGFSDGASYALSIGLINGDLFSRVAAFSPGFVGRGQYVGKPAIFVSHGTDDQVLPIGRTSRVLVPRLEDAGYKVEYHEFAGRHRVDPELLRRASKWLAATR
jgi:predicted esterase